MADLKELVTEYVKKKQNHQRGCIILDKESGCDCCLRHIIEALNDEIERELEKPWKADAADSGIDSQGGRP